MLPAAMAIAALALLLGFVPRRIAGLALALAAALALSASRVTLPTTSSEIVFIGCWSSVAAAAVLAWLPGAKPRALVLALAAVTGVCAGLAIAAEGQPGDLVRAALAALLVLPAAFAVARGFAIVPRVVAGWLVAVALLAAALPYVVAHPGYVPDHRE